MSMIDEERLIDNEPGADAGREWQPRGRDFDAGAYRTSLLAIFEAARTSPAWDQDTMMRILAQHPRDSKGYFSKIELVTGYQQLTAAGELPFERQVLRRLQMKPIRTSSGVAPVTVLTEPAGCPGRCIFCPDDVRMPKSYLPNEPGARRAEQCGFDPYLQVRTRLDTFEAMGHTRGQGGAADPGRHLERLLAALPRVVRAALPGRHERRRTADTLAEAQAPTRRPRTATWAW